MADAKPITKVCTKCGEEKPLHDYHAKKERPDGRAAHCRACANAEARDRWSSLSIDARRRKNKKGTNGVPYSEWPEELRARARARKAKYRLQAGRKPMAQIQAEAKAKNESASLWDRNAKQAFEYWLRDRMTDEQASRYWQATGKPWRNPRLTEAEKYKMRYALDVEFQVKERMRRQINKAKKRDGIADVMRYAINKGGSSRKVEREFGYSVAELMSHVERQFTRGMTWEKFRSAEIHIDHIVPQAAFDLADDDEWRRCWCLSNLRPMWARENIVKSAKVMTLC